MAERSFSDFEIPTEKRTGDRRKQKNYDYFSSIVDDSLKDPDLLAFSVFGSDKSTVEFSVLVTSNVSSNKSNIERSRADSILLHFIGAMSRSDVLRRKLTGAGFPSKLAAVFYFCP